MPRALYWFRWGAAFTWLTGFLLLGMVYYMSGATLEDPAAGWSGGAIAMIVVTFVAVVIYDALWSSPLASNLRAAVITSYVLVAIVVAAYVYVGHFSQRGTLIHTGVLFGSTMAFNVWFRIWPAQQKIITAVKNGSPLPPTDPIVKVAGLRSRHNTYMSLPLLWAMIGQHTTFFFGGNWGIPSDYYWVFWLLIIIVGWHIIFQCYKKAGKVQGF